MSNGVRYIGIRHRRKRTAQDEARPTQLAFLENGQTRTMDLETEDDELDFVKGQLPSEMRPPNPGEDLSKINERHITWRKLDPESGIQIPEAHTKKEGRTTFYAYRVPASYEGLRAGDMVSMMLGGSGDNLAFALSRRGEAIGASVWRIPPFMFTPLRGSDKQDQDAEKLASLLPSRMELFYHTWTRDRILIKIRECLRARTDAMKARIACEQRLRQFVVGQIFRSEEGLFPEGGIEAEFDKAKANDMILRTLMAEEKRRNRELEKALDQYEPYLKLFEPITGVGPMISARIISAIIDIRRFSTKHKLKKFMGAHVLPDGRFPRRRTGEIANWHPDARQALYLLGDQFNRRPDSVWGKRLLENKKMYRQRHPEPVTIEGKKKYTNAHIHKMATWRTITEFVEWLWGAWWELEEAAAKERSAA